MAQRHEQGEFRRECPASGTSRCLKPLGGSEIMGTDRRSVAGIPVRHPEVMSFYGDNDSIGLCTALILTIVRPDSSFVTSQPRRRGVHWMPIMIGAGREFRQLY